MPHLFSPLTLRGLTLRNRVVMSPMCMYAAAGNGLMTDWHVTHYLSRAVGGVGLVLQEATAVEPRGRITEHDLGLWNDEQVEPLARLVHLVRREGAAVGLQLGHAGRKAWATGKGVGPEPAVGPSALEYGEGWPAPHELTREEIGRIVAAWRDAAARADAAGYDVVEIHGAHGYLCHQFLSAIANHRTDDYGGSASNRLRFLLEVVGAVREIWPERKPLFVRLSVTDWTPGGLTPDQVAGVARELAGRGVDLIDCSSGGIHSSPPPGPTAGYQVPFAELIRREGGIATSAVGLITTPELANEIVGNGRADLVLLGRELLRNPYWPLHAARVLGQTVNWPKQYERARLT